MPKEVNRRMAQWLTTGRIASVMGVTAEAVRGWIVTGVFVPGRTERVRLRAIDAGRYLVKKSWLEEFLKAIEVEAPEADPAQRQERQPDQQQRFTDEQDRVSNRLKSGR
jgi:hypothetical protein